MTHHDTPREAFGIDTDKMIDRAMEKLGPIIDRSLSTFTAAVATVDASIKSLVAEQQRTNTLLQQIIDNQKP
jgi:hypothetical protein